MPCIDEKWMAFIFQTDASDAGKKALGLIAGVAAE
jgi:hypothetical protein